MCGICGIVRHRGKEDDAPAIRRMLKSLEHRGPDGSGAYFDDAASLGHARLSIIDLAGGAQPLANETERIWLSFNGEIFNYRELRSELIPKGHVFRTQSDSEVIIHAWEEWGPEAFGRFNGQWGLALWDSREKELILSVDPYGIRPVFYSENGGSLVFASEVKAIFQEPSISRSLDVGGLQDVYRTWGLLGERTCFGGVKRLLPGSILRYKEGTLRIEGYRTPALTEPHAADADAAGIRQALLDAANLRFTRSDVPVGAYLSGGLDSSIIASILTRHTQVDLQTFSIRFGDPEFDEGEFQKTLAEELGSVHHSIFVDDKQMMEAFPTVVLHTEQPILRTAPIPMYLLSKLVHGSGFKVVVTGEGADEFFAGYDIFKETVIRAAILEGANAGDIDRMLAQLYPWMARSPGEAGGMGRGFFSRNLRSGDPFMSHRTRWDNGIPLLSMLASDAEAKDSGDIGIELPSGFGEWSPLFKAQWLEARTLLNGYLLSAQGDRMLMANSVEGRFPFLDPNVTAMANALSDSEKLSEDFEEKSVLKSVFRDIIPQSISSRPKQPYRAPDASALFNAAPLPWMEEVMSDSYIERTDLFNPRVVQGLFRKCRMNRGKRMSNRDNMMAVAAVSTLLLHDGFIERHAYCDERVPELIIDKKTPSV